MKELGPIVVCSNPSLVFMVDAKTFLIPLVLVSLLGDVLLETGERMARNKYMNVILDRAINLNMFL